MWASHQTSASCIELFVNRTQRRNNFCEPLSVQQTFYCRTFILYAFVSISSEMYICSYGVVCFFPLLALLLSMAAWRRKLPAKTNDPKRATSFKLLSKMSRVLCSHRLHVFTLIISHGTMYLHDDVLMHRQQTFREAKRCATWSKDVIKHKVDRKCMGIYFCYTFQEDWMFAHEIYISNYLTQT